MEKRLTVTVVAARLGLKERTIRRMMVERRMDTVRPSPHAVRMPGSAVKDIIRRGVRAAVERGEHDHE